MSWWASDFSFDYFRSILKAVKSNFDSYTISEIPSTFDTFERHKIILRHDVDVSLEKAVKMAEIEHGLGICSTYLILVKSPLYSIEEKDSQDMLFKIIDMGHEVGLHHDKGEINLCKEQLENVMGMPVLSISFHCPTQSLLMGPLMISDMISAYAKELMGWYISDSGGLWRDGSPIPKLLRPKKPLLQVLMHPIWWDDIHLFPEDRLQMFFNEKSLEQPPKLTSQLDDAIFNATKIKRRGLKK